MLQELDEQAYQQEKVAELEQRLRKADKEEKGEEEAREIAQEMEDEEEDQENFPEHPFFVDIANPNRPVRFHLPSSLASL